MSFVASRLRLVTLGVQMHSLYTHRLYPSSAPAGVKIAWASGTGGSFFVLAKQMWSRGHN